MQVSVKIIHFALQNTLSKVKASASNQIKLFAPNAWNLKDPDNWGNTTYILLSNLKSRKARILSAREELKPQRTHSKDIH